ncbi:hypothetical protein A3K73_08115 [Candidatus Pacearchaeota archaeon RBG_13_36_9]|nr:MAG: hypothetical protein A3K73_08115 [Candidatus Pacearchaeota archaeon RBG_13_36_9]
MKKVMMKETISTFIRNIWFYSLIKPKVSFLRFFGAKIGKNCQLYNSLLNYDLRLLKFLEVGDNVIIAKRSMIFTHDGATSKMKEFGISKAAFNPVKIKDNVFIGAGTIILPNVTIGENAIIGAGSVITKDIPDNCIAAGNPAKIIRRMDKNESSASH